MLLAVCRQPTVLVLLHLLACGAAEPLLNLHAGNFDRVIEQHDHVVVHFWAPEDQTCEQFKSIHEEVAATEVGSRMVHGMSDVTDIRGFTSYLENWGVTRLPTLVLFRKGRAQQYPHKGASFQLPTVQEIEAWLSQMTASDAKWSSRENADLMFTDENLEEEEVLRRARQGALAAAAQVEEHMTGRQSDDKVVIQVEPAAANSDESPPAKQSLGSKSGPGKQNLLEASPDPADHSSGEGIVGSPLEASSNSAELTANGADEADSDAVEQEACGALLRLHEVTDSSFKQVVLHDTSTAILVLFYRPSLKLCAVNGTTYAEFAQTASADVQAMRMDVAQNNSPFMFEPDELPVIMIFPANNKKPLEFTGRLSIEALESFVLEHAGGRLGKVEL